MALTDYVLIIENLIATQFLIDFISDQIQRLKGANYFTIFDATSGFL